MNGQLLVPVTVEEDGHVLAECYVTCLSPEPGHGHLLATDFARAVSSALATTNPSISLVSVDVTRGGDVLVSTVLGAHACDVLVSIVFGAEA